MKEGRGARDEGRGVEMRGARCEERVTFCQLHTANRILPAAYYSLFAIRYSLSPDNILNLTLLLSALNPLLLRPSGAE